MKQHVGMDNQGEFVFSSTLARRLIRESMRREDISDLFLLGWNAVTNRIDSSIMLESSGGCYRMPHVNVGELARASGSLNKRNKIPCGYFLSSHDEDLFQFISTAGEVFDATELRDFKYIYGTSIMKFLFFTYIKSQRKFYALKFMKTSNTFQYFNVSISNVNTNRNHF